jgi:hypothetical protein
MFNIIWSAIKIKDPALLITILTIAIIIIFSGFFIYKQITLKHELNNKIKLLNQLTNENEIIKHKLHNVELALEYYERNMEIASYAREQTIINNNHYHQDTKHTKEVIREFKESDKNTKDYYILLKNFNYKFKDL